MSLCAAGDGLTFHEAARIDELQACVDFLNEGGDVDALDAGGNTALHVAAADNRVRSAIYLLTKGIDADHENNDGLRAIDLAERSGHTGMQRLLSARGASLTGVEAALERRLHLAILRDDLVQVGVRILKGEGVNSQDPERGWTPLHVAALHNEPKMVELFVAMGADPNAVDFVGQRPLHFVAELGNLDIASQLIAAGADVNAVVTKSGATALQMAVLSGNHDMVRLLIDRDAGVNAVDKRGWAPIHVVALKGYADICKTLLENGADAGISTKQDYSARLIAMASENHDVLKVLDEYAQH